MHTSRRAVAGLAWSVVVAVPACGALEAAGATDASLVIRCVLLLLFCAALAGVSPGDRRPGLGLAPLAASAVVWGLLAGLGGSGIAHDALTACAYVGLLLGTQFVTMALRLDPVWRPPARPLAWLAWAAVVPALLLAETRARDGSLAGLYERIFLDVELAWLLVASTWIGLRAVHAEPPPR